ncbi:type II toxin-antitoxin system VapC family toxin [Sphingomonas sp. CD22]|uniref:type II toxin-antitoxin system VapC family toxin n=1 Tax=Sphingomonas sp. CD22 TaxID=3100214 RepID=UPI002AE03421|nr:type II toxin-antitoxin system VapC family toxin [Sphingomonas sp. CD22]MEA1083271.1 type II toxin-antitoxin system VapC family toxin [Sphingomonas sp. CD22]
MTVVDASAVLALIFEEPGSAMVLAQCRGALFSAVNLDEILHKVARHGLDPAAVEEQLTKLQIIVVPFDAGQARVSAALHPRVHGTDTSFADRACLSLALATGGAVLTADTKWRTLGLDLDIRLIR